MIFTDLPNAAGLKIGGVFVHHGRRFRTKAVSHSTGAAGYTNKVEAVEVSATGRNFRHYTKAIRTLLKLGVQNDTLLVCVDLCNGTTQGKNRIVQADIVTPVPLYKGPSGTPEVRSDADFVRRCTDPRGHPKAKLVAARVLAERKGASAIRRLARDLAAEGFVVLQTSKRLRGDVGFRLRVRGKWYRLHRVR